MGVFPIGGQRVGIVTDVVTGYTEFNEPITTEVTVWWDGCVLEMQTMSEQQGAAVTTSEMAVVVGPVAGDQIPAVDDNDDPVPLAVADLKSDRKLRHDGRTYVMRADAVLQKDIRGRADHCECLCEHEEG